MDSRVQKIELWLRSSSRDGTNDIVGMLVICGMGGLGKTTTARYIFNSNHERFDGCSFLGNIREASKNTKDLHRLQRQFLTDIQKKPEKKIDNIDDGLRRIRYVLKNKRILLVLDDVDDVDQLHKIVGMRNWFTPGSRIIITSRHEDLLKPHENYVVHRIENLNDEESLELFSMHAFGERVPDAGFVEHSKRFVNHCQGLPLALKVLGSSVSGKSLEVWNSALASLESISETKIVEKLKISYDSLDNKKLQNLFLDIACFFVGRDKNDTITILDESEYYTALGIQKLVDRNLLSVGENNKLGMHQLLQDMGRQVVREESTKPTERTRLWDHKDSFNVLQNKTGSAKLEGLILDMKMLKKNKNPARKLTWADQNDDEFLETESFKRMHNLRLLKLSYVKLSGKYVEFSHNLTLLCLRGFHLKSLPNGFLLKKIVSLDLRNSSLTQLWKETKVLETLKILNLSHSHDLAKTPNFLAIPNLEKLILKDCPCLIEIDESIAFLERLILLDLKDCKNLRRLPRSISLVKSLEQLIISGCSNLEGVAEELANMESLKGLFADRMSINQILNSTIDEFAPATSYQFLPWLTKPMKNPETSSWVSLPRSLVTLSLRDSNLIDGAFPMDFGNLPMLEYLNLGGNQICKLPDFIRKLRRLKKLDLSWCRSLEQIEWPEVNVKELILTECRSLQRITYETLVGPQSISHGACMSLNYIEQSFKIEAMENVDAGVLHCIGFFDFETKKTAEVFIVNGIVWSRKKLRLQVIYEAYRFNTYFPGKDVPSYFTEKATHSKISFIVPSTSSLKIRGLNTCLVYTFPMDMEEWPLAPLSVKISNKSKGFDLKYTPRCYGIPDADGEYLIWLCHWFQGIWGFLFEKGDEVEVFFIMNVVGGRIKECGVNILYYDEGGVAKYFNTLFSSWDSGMDLFYSIRKRLDDGGLSVKGKNNLVIRFMDDCNVRIDGGSQKEEENVVILADKYGSVGEEGEEEEEEKKVLSTTHEEEEEGIDDVILREMVDRASKAPLNVPTMTKEKGKEKEIEDVNVASSTPLVDVQTGVPLTQIASHSTPLATTAGGAALGISAAPLAAGPLGVAAQAQVLSPAASDVEDLASEDKTVEVPWNGEEVSKTYDYLWAGMNLSEKMKGLLSAYARVDGSAFVEIEKTSLKVFQKAKVEALGDLLVELSTWPFERLQSEESKKIEASIEELKSYGVHCHYLKDRLAQLQVVKPKETKAILSGYTHQYNALLAQINASAKRRDEIDRQLEELRIMMDNLVEERNTSEAHLKAFEKEIQNVEAERMKSFEKLAQYLPKDDPLTALSSVESFFFP